jgi:exosortase/archaeosortase family protein
MMPPVLVAALVMAATWDAWRWYLGRVATAPVDAATLVLIVAFLGGLGVLRRSQAPEPRPAPLFLVAAVLAAYAAGYLVLPPIARAAVAIAVTLFCLHCAAFRTRPPVAFWGLVALALPVVPSLQFTLGYPLRVVSAALAVGLLQMHGIGVTRQGTFLLWRDEMVQFDAPCSGVNMLWAGLLLTLAVCVMFRLGPLKVALAVVLSLALTVAANVLRASSLFYLETGFIAHSPAWWHDGVGVAVFVVASAVILWAVSRMALPSAPHEAIA